MKKNSIFQTVLVTMVLLTINFEAVLFAKLFIMFL